MTFAHFATDFLAFSKTTFNIPIRNSPQSKVKNKPEISGLAISIYTSVIQ